MAMNEEAETQARAKHAAASGALFRWLLAASIAFVIGATTWTQFKGSAPLIDADDERLVGLGKSVYAERCAFCHGTNLEGQPAWRKRRADGRLPAPPHDASGHTWHHPDALLIDIVRYGFTSGRNAPPGYASDMPGFENTLSDKEIRASLAFIKSSWPEPLRAQQARVTREATARR